MRFNVFNSNTKLLPAFCKPYEDEALGSWLTRVSFGHGLARSSLLNLIGLDCRNNGDWNVDRQLSREQVLTLAKHTNSTQGEIWNSTIRCYENALSDTSGATPYHLGLWTVKRNRSKAPIVGSSGPTTLYCPSCFARNGMPVYYRRDWQLIVSFVCMDCKCYLREQCPHCNHGPSHMNLPQHSFVRKSIDQYLITCNTCDKNISHCDPEPAPKHIVQLQKKINKCLRGNQIKFTSSDYFKALYKISCMLLKGESSPFFQLAGDLFTMLNVKDHRNGKPNQGIQKLAVRQQADIFFLADQLIRDWPNPFVGLANKYVLPKSEILEYFKGMPEWLIKPLQENLNDLYVPVKKSSKTYDPYQESYRIYLDCSTVSDYDYNPDEDYYNREIDDIDCSIFPRKSGHSATDLIYYQMQKSGWA